MPTGAEPVSFGPVFQAPPGDPLPMPSATIAQLAALATGAEAGFETVVRDATAMFNEQRQATEALAADSEAGLESIVRDAAAMFSEQRQATEAAATMAQQSANITAQGIAEAHRLKSDLADLKLGLKNVLLSNHSNMLTMQDQISELRNSAQTRDKTMAVEIQQAPASSVQLKASVHGALNVQTDKFEQLIRSLFEVQRSEGRKELQETVDSSSADQRQMWVEVKDKLNVQVATAMKMHDTHVSSELGQFMSQAKAAFDMLQQQQQMQQQRQYQQQQQRRQQAQQQQPPLQFGPALQQASSSSLSGGPSTLHAAGAARVTGSGGGGPPDDDDDDEDDDEEGDDENYEEEEEEEDLYSTPTPKPPPSGGGGSGPPPGGGGGSGPPPGGGGGGGGGPSGPEPARATRPVAPRDSNKPKEREKVVLKGSIPVGSPLLARQWENIVYSCCRSAARVV